MRSDERRREGNEDKGEKAGGRYGWIDVQARRPPRKAEPFSVRRHGLGERRSGGLVHESYSAGPERWVEDDVSDVDEQVQDDVDQSEHDDRSLDDGKVARMNRLDY